MLLENIDYKPSLPSHYMPAIGIIGVGNIVRNEHLKAYKKYGIKVHGVYDVLPTSIQQAQAMYDVGIAYPTLEALLNDPAIEVVDVATHPAERPFIIQQALEAGKHVLSQKPFALDIATAQNLIDLAAAKNLKLAVNQNGRWAPPWRIATRLVEAGVTGEVISVTHLFDVHFGWVADTIFDAVKHWLFYDYAVHWFDITRCWMGDTPLEAVRAREYRAPNQGEKGIATWAGWAEFEYANGANAMLRSIGGSRSAKSGHLFWVHGTRGTVHGSVIPNDAVTLEVGDTIINYRPEGAWFPDGFAGTMGELLTAIAENREPSNSAAHNLLSLQMTLAACQSAEQDGLPVYMK